MREAGRALTLPAEETAASLVESIAEAYLSETGRGARDALRLGMRSRISSGGKAGRVAQWIEHQPSKLRVAGSSPAAPAILAWGEACPQKRSSSFSPRTSMKLHPVNAGCRGMRRRQWALSSTRGRSAGPLT